MSEEVIRGRALAGLCLRCGCYKTERYIVGSGEAGWVVQDLAHAPTYKAVCADCLTPREIAKQLERVALFVMEQLRDLNPVPEMAYACDFLRFRVGYYESDESTEALVRAALSAVTKSA